MDFNVTLSNYSASHHKAQELAEQKGFVHRVMLSELGPLKDGYPHMDTAVYAFHQQKDIGPDDPEDVERPWLTTALVTSVEDAVIRIAGFSDDDSDWSIDVVARTPDKAREIAEEHKSFFHPKKEPTEYAIPSNFWFGTSDGPESKHHSLKVFPWADVRRNYSGDVQRAVDDLVGFKKTPEKHHGRMIVLHGPPGTGKTNLIRSIASEWRNWSRLNVVLDPDRMLNETSYLTSVVNMGGRKSDLIVLEDAGELVSQESKQTNGQMISRLLNLADGLASEWSDAFFLVTTNEKIDELDKALTRSGRCMAAIEVGPLSSYEASEWLGEPVSEPTTLADLFVRKNKSEGVIRLKEPVAETGMYL